MIHHCRGLTLPFSKFPQEKFEDTMKYLSTNIIFLRMMVCKLNRNHCIGIFTSLSVTAVFKLTVKQMQSIFEGGVHFKAPFF